MKRTIVTMGIAASAFLSAAAQHTTFDADIALQEQKDNAFAIIIKLGKKSNDPENMEKALKIVKEIYDLLKDIKNKESKTAPKATTVDPMAKQRDAEQLKIDSLNAEIDARNLKLTDRCGELAAYRNNPQQLQKFINNTKESIDDCEKVFHALIDSCISTYTDYDPTRIRRANAACNMMVNVNPVEKEIIENCPTWYDELSNLRTEIAKARNKGANAFTAQAAELSNKLNTSAYVVATRADKNKRVRSLENLVKKMRASLNVHANQEQ